MSSSQGRQESETRIQVCSSPTLKAKQEVNESGDRNVVALVSLMRVDMSLSLLGASCAV